MCNVNESWLGMRLPKGCFWHAVEFFQSAMRPTWIVDTRRCTSCTDMKFDLHPSPKEPIGWKVRSLGAKLTLRSGAACQCQVLFRSRLEIELFLPLGIFAVSAVQTFKVLLRVLHCEWLAATHRRQYTRSSLSHINESLSDLYYGWTCFSLSPSTHKSTQIWVSPFDTLCGLHLALSLSSVLLMGKWGQDVSSTDQDQYQRRQLESRGWFKAMSLVSND